MNRRLRWAIYFAVLFAAPIVYSAAFGADEDFYNRQWCADNGGIAEYRLPDKSRIDCLLAGHYANSQPFYIAVEADWAHKWAEGVGQAQHYANSIRALRGGAPTVPGVLFLAHKNPKGYKTYLLRLCSAAPLGLVVWLALPQRTFIYQCRSNDNDEKDP